MDLAIFDRAKQAITEPVTIDEFMDIRDKAEAMRKYAHPVGEVVY